MTISQNKVVALTYELKLNDANGEFVEKTEAGNPLVFLYGAGQMIPDFEKNISGLTVGDTFAFGITAENAYGPLDEEAVVPIPREVFAEAEDMLQVGQIIPMRNDQGHMLQGLVVEVSDNQVTMDFNHPMAGKNLYFTGEIEELRDATAEELDHGHVHGPGGHHH
ncbi:MAG: peptidylprolyl isomerase [Saprospiraceae bacterium]|nr:peptidylprolyl isomerase [Saprospiraceae bacterium]